MQVAILTDEEFGLFADEMEYGNHMQTLEMKKLQKARGGSPHLLGVKEGDQILAGALITVSPLRMGKAVTVNGGLLAKTTESGLLLLEGIKQFTKDLNGLYLTITPMVPRKITDWEGQNEQVVNAEVVDLYQQKGFSHQIYDSKMSTTELNWIYLKDLTFDSPKALFQSFNKKTVQYSIKQARKFGTEIVELTRDELPRFKEITAETADRQGYQDKTLEYYQTVYDTYGDRVKFIGAKINFANYLEQITTQEEKLKRQLAKVNAHLEKNPDSRKKNNQRQELQSQLMSMQKRKDEAEDWVATYGDKEILVAAAQFFVSPQIVTYVFAGSDERFKKLHAPYLIQEYMMNYALESSIPHYNFLGIDGVFDGSDGVFQFKKSFKGYAAQMIGAFDWAPHPYKYKMYQMLKKMTGR